MSSRGNYGGGSVRGGFRGSGGSGFRGAGGPGSFRGGPRGSSSPGGPPPGGPYGGGPYGGGGGRGGGFGGPPRGGRGGGRGGRGRAPAPDFTRDQLEGLDEVQIVEHHATVPGVQVNPTGPLDVQSNHYTLDIVENRRIEVHDVKFRARGPAPKVEDRLEALIDLYKRRQWPLPPVYDGEAKLIHPQRLNLSHKFQGKKGPIQIDITWVEGFNSQDAMTGGTNTSALAAVDIILHVAAAERASQTKKVFIINNNKFQLGLSDYVRANDRCKVSPYAMLMGHIHGVQLTGNSKQQLSVVFNTTGKVGVPEMPLEEYIKERTGISFSMLKPPVDPVRGERLLRELRAIIYKAKHYGHGRKIKIVGIARESARSHCFSFEGRQVSCEEYFDFHYGIHLQYPEAPLLEVHPKGRNNYFPFEVLFATRQTREAAVMQLLHTLRPKVLVMPPRDRAQWIQRCVEETLGSADLLEDFGFNLSAEPIQVRAEQLPAPKIAYTKANDRASELLVAPTGGVWNLEGFGFEHGMKGKWAVLNLDFQLDTKEHLRPFFAALVERSKKLNMEIEPDPCRFFRPPHMDLGRQDLKKIATALEDSGASLMIILIPKNDDDLYFQMKCAFDTVCSTQVCVTSKTPGLGKPATGRAAESHLSNILLSLQLKMGGGCQRLVQTSQTVFQHFIGNPDETVILGADLCLPVRLGDLDQGVGREELPSIAALVGSMNSNQTIYAHAPRGQLGGQDRIQEFADMFESIVAQRGKHNENKIWPKRIIYLRDGVSDGELVFILKQEVEAIEALYRQASQPKPRIMAVSVRKRHLTRFFTADNSELNVGPGVFVTDSLSIPSMVNFYLVSHAGRMGTSKPTRYVIMRDDIIEDTPLGTLDKREKVRAYAQFMFELCHLYGTCASSVSLPAPVYHAHKLADRIRAHVDPIAQRELGVAVLTKPGAGGGDRSKAKPRLDSVQRFFDAMNSKLKEIETNSQAHFFV